MRCVQGAEEGEGGRLETLADMELGARLGCFRVPCTLAVPHGLFQQIPPLPPSPGIMHV